MTGFTGTLRLTRLALRRDRVLLPAWILGLGLFEAATTAMFVGSIATRADAVQETQLVATNPGMRMLGITSAANVGNYMLYRDFLTLAVLAALMSVFAVVRHTRQNEELGRAEMLGATVVGRYAGLAAAVVVAVAANIALAGVLGLAILVNGQPVPGSLLAGASVGAVGLVFTGVAAVSAQVASTTRGASGLAGAVLGVSFLLSGIGNTLGSADAAGLRVTSAWPSWLSPIGWAQQTRPFGGDLWWPLGLAAALFVVLLPAAVVLAGRRDVGRGLAPERRGHARASTALLSQLGLVWRLQRGALAGWAVGMLAFGLIFGALVESIQDVHGKALEWYTRMGGTDRIVDAYRASIIAMAGMFVTFYVVQILLRLRSDEAGGTLESTLATGVSRSRWLLAYALNALAGAVVLVLTFAVSMGLAAGTRMGGTTAQVRELTGAALVQLPGIVTLGGAVIALVGLLPRWAAPISWALVVGALIVGPMFGPSLDLPRLVQDLSPFTHVPKVSAVAASAPPLVLLTAVCLTLAAVGLAGLRRRDLALPV